MCGNDTDMAEKTTAIIVGAVGAGVGVVALLGLFVLSIIVWHHWRKSKGELLSLKYQLEKAVAQPGSVVDPNLIPLAEFPNERPSSPPSQPRPVITENAKSSGYSSVNKLSLLPDSVRTAENLEGRTIPNETEGKLLEKYLKDRKEYEEKQLQICEGMKASRGDGAVTSSRPTSVPIVGKKEAAVVLGKPSLYYDTIELPEDTQKKIVVNDSDEYGQPVDALSQPVQTPVAVVAVASKPLTDAQQRNVVNASALGQAYTPVYKPQQPPDGQGGMRLLRTASDASPRRYENSSMVQEGVREAEGRKTEGSKGATSRRPAKEEVEFDPERQRMFRMTSKRGKDKGKGGDDHTDDAGNGETPLEKPPGSEVMPAQAKQGSSLDYALVNVSDKRKNRVGEDVTKCEGSGVPQHIMVVPVLSS